jgi:hypothetical protein
MKNKKEDINEMENDMRLSMVKAEVKTAYADCAPDAGQETYGIRKLDFRAPYSVSKEQAIQILRKEIPHGYNLFNAQLLKHLPDNARVTIAREGSVCIYVFLDGSPLHENKAMKYDEFYYNPQTQETRIWWD